MFISPAWTFLLNFRLYFQSPALCLQSISNLTCPNRIPVFFLLNLFFSKPSPTPWMTPSSLSYSIKKHGIFFPSFTIPIQRLSNSYQIYFKKKVSKIWSLCANTTTWSWSRPTLPVNHIIVFKFFCLGWVLAAACRTFIVVYGLLI